MLVKEQPSSFNITDPAPRADDHLRGGPRRGRGSEVCTWKQEENELAWSAGKSWHPPGDVACKALSLS